MIMIGRMAKEYGMLPSQVEQQATTYDIMITDVLATYDNYQQQKQSGKVDPSVYEYSQDELMKMMEQKHGNTNR
jgi:hypothetical protein